MYRLTYSFFENMLGLKDFVNVNSKELMMEEVIRGLFRLCGDIAGERRSY